jgi:hypothetical protein
MQFTQHGVNEFQGIMYFQITICLKNIRNQSTPIQRVGRFYFVPQRRWGC